MPKKETKTLIILLLLIDIISIGSFVFLYLFTKNIISGSVNKESEIRAELKKEDTRVLMKDDLALGKIYQDKLMGYVIPSGGTVDFIKIVESLVSNSGLTADIKDVSTENYDKGNALGLELLRINMNVMGEWKNVNFFLTSLENYPLKIDISNVSLSEFSNFVVKGKSVPEWSGNFEFTVVKAKDIK